MKIFLSYASEDQRIAEEIEESLKIIGHKVFFGKHLPPAKEFHHAIRQNIKKSKLLIFLVSPDSIAAGSYTLTELKFAEEKWSVPERHVLPVLVRPIEDFSLIPGYLRVVTVLKPEGNIVAETVAEVERRSNRIRAKVKGIILLILLIALPIGLIYFNKKSSVFVCNSSILPEMVEIPADSFWFSDTETGRNSRKYLSTYWISRYEITNEQYKRYRDDNPNIARQSGFDKANFNVAKKPVVGISRFEAVEYCSWLSRETGRNFNLPSETQWEKAARGSTKNIYPWGNDPPTQERANFNNPYSSPNIVTDYAYGKSQEFGIYNMAGNVAEWCLNELSENAVVRGGSFRDRAHFLKIHVRNELKSDGLPWVGFRVVCVKE